LCYLSEPSLRESLFFPVSMLSELSLTLHESPDVHDGIVRLDPADMRLMGILPKEVVALFGVRMAYATVLPAYMEDRNQRLALVSPLLRRNIGVPSGHKIQVIAERKKPVIAETLHLRLADDLDLLHLSARQNQLSTYWHERVIVTEDWLQIPTLDRTPLMVQVTAVQPEGLVQIVSGTTYALSAEKAMDGLPGIGGLRDVCHTCRSLGVARLKSGLTLAARSVLLTGPSGCGKARLVKRLSAELGVPLVTLDAYQLLDKQVAHNPADLGVSLTDLARRGPTLLLLDHLEALSTDAPSPLALATASRTVVARLCALLDEVFLQPNIMAFSVLSGALDPRFKERQRFDVVLPVDAPNRLERHEILTLNAHSLQLSDKVDLAQLAAITSGATARDLSQLVTAAARLAAGPCLAEEDFTAALRSMEFSALSEVRCDVPEVSWNDVAGLDDIKQLLRETLSWSLKHHDRFADAGIKPPRSILLSGGQGTGKTSLVRALPTVVPLNFIEISCPTLATLTIVKATAVLRDSFALARRKSTCLVFFDDLDVLFDVRGVDDAGPGFSPLVAQLLIELDDLSLLPGVIVIASTNRPDRLSQEILRPGRFDFAVTLPMPDHSARKKILQIHAHKLPLAADVDFDHLAGIMNGMSPAEIAGLCNRVGIMALRQSLSEESGGLLPPVANAALFEQAMRGRKS
jgi:transitional endoplasmic reticulum ATPase